VINNLVAADAKVIGVDFIFNSGNPTQKSGDKELLEATMKAPEIIYPVVLDLKINRNWLRWQQDQIRIKDKELPFTELASQANDLGYINLMIDRDGLIRRLPLLESTEKYSSFSQQVASKFREKEINADQNGLINYVGPVRSFPMVSYLEVLNNDFSEKLVKDKIVLLGATAPALGDRYMTPYSPFGAMYGVEVHANAIQTLLNDSAITNLDFKFTGLIILILGLINSYLFIRFGPGLGVLILIGEIIILPIIVLIFLIRYDLWLNLISYLLNITLIYLVVLGYYYLWAKRNFSSLFSTRIAK
jgi:adenylate cyclase